MNKSQIALWALYDFAITVLELNVAFYLSEWLIIDQGVNEFLYSAAIAVSLIFSVLLLPVLGLLSDRDGRRMPYFRFFTFFGALMVVLVGYVGLTTDNHFLLVFLTMGCFMLLNISYQGCLVFYNALLSSVAPSKSTGLISGLGIAAGYIGAIVGGFIVSMFVNDHIPFLNISVPLIDHPSRVNAFIPSAMLFLIFSAPTMLFLRESKLRETLKERLRRIKQNIQKTPSNYQIIIEDMKRFKQYPEAVRFLASFFFFNDAVATILLFGPIYMENILGIPDNMKLTIIISALVAAAIGGAASGFIADRRGKKETLQIILGLWIAVLMMIVWVKSLPLFWALYTIGGLLFGSTWAVSRALFVDLIPENEHGKFFSIYSIFERFAAIAGPLLWGGIIVVLDGWGKTKYQIALGSMMLLIAAGILILRRLKTPKILTKAQ